jgi:hypothetical protein
VVRDFLITEISNTGIKIEVKKAIAQVIAQFIIESINEKDIAFQLIQIYNQLIELQNRDILNELLQNAIDLFKVF